MLFKDFFDYIAGILAHYKLPSTVLAVYLFYQGYDLLYNQLHQSAVTHLNQLPATSLKVIKDFGIANFLNMVFAAYSVRVVIKSYGSMVYKDKV